MSGGSAPIPLRRHQIARLGCAGWRRVQDRDWAAAERECLVHWAARCLPLVVTRQTGLAGTDTVALGLPAPGRWGRRRLALTVARGDLLDLGEFPLAERALGLLPIRARTAWRRLCAGLDATGVRARVYGSYGWQLLSGLDHVRAGSDVDLWLSVADAEQADAAATLLDSWSGAPLRLDGELVFGDGTAVAWREWQAWRAGCVRSLLVKTLDGGALVTSARWHAAATPTAAP